MTLQTPHPSVRARYLLTHPEVLQRGTLDCYQARATRARTYRLSVIDSRTTPPSKHLLVFKRADSNEIAGIKTEIPSYFAQHRADLRKLVAKLPDTCRRDATRALETVACETSEDCSAPIWDDG